MPKDPQDPADEGGRTPPAWLMLAAGAVILVIGAFRYTSDAGSWQISVVFGVVALVMGGAIAVRKRSLR
ncbi:hypothetical protein GCM10009737_00190 [Nocardioides lentus]|uniref:DUF2631 domain-containing protein n=1 Tax=Nocardioides lentus TaxID=338077 RepID=A0ABN2NUK8_9ACTN